MFLSVLAMQFLGARLCELLGANACLLVPIPFSIFYSVK
jgi:hypothetical protein